MNDQTETTEDSEEQIKRRLERALKRSLTMPPKPQKPKADKQKPKKKD